MCETCKLENLEYENIHSHSMYSNIYTPDSIISKEDIAIRAKELGHQTISLVEHGYFSNIFEVYPIAKEYNLKMIFGSEVYFVKDRFEKDMTNAHLLIVAKNEKGKKELTGIISEANKTGFYGKPRVDEELLFSLSPNDVIVTTACLGSPIRKYEDYADEFLLKCKNHFGKNFFLEIQPHTMVDQIEFNFKLKEYRKKYDIPFILGIDTHYIFPQDSKNRDLFLQGKKMHYPEEEGMIIDYPTTEDIISRLKKQGVLDEEEIREAFSNTLIVREFQNIAIGDDVKMPSLYPDLSHEEKVVKLKEILVDAWKEDSKNISKDKWSEYKDAIRFETEIVSDTKMEDYFLLNHKIIDRAVNEYGGILTRTGRGSGPSFYINKLLGFTEIDRLDAPIELYPTRFMSKSRILETKSLPDIDLNTADPKPFIKASKDILGEDNVYLMTAYGKMKDSEAFRNYCRALNLDIKEFNDVGKNLDSYKNHKKWGPIIKESQMFIGVIDSVSPHPCATLILDKPISQEVGVIKIKDEYVALIDSDNSDKYNYLKNDFLTVTVWDIIAKVYEKIGMEIDDVRSLKKKTEGDSNVWELYEKGLVSTLNQAGTDSGKPQVMIYKPKSIRELSGWVSAIRPAFSSMKQYFLNREEFSYGIPEFDKLLESSDNFILFQENIMRVLIYAGFSEDKTYGLLKAIAKKKEGIIEPIKEKFLNGFIEKTGSEENAEKVWQIIEDAVGYGFNSSHAYSVALDSLYGAYLKANFPLDYYSVILNIYQGNTTKTAEIEQELEAFDIKMDSVKFGESRADYSANYDSRVIYKGLQSIKFLNKQVSEELYSLSREEEYLNNKKTVLDLFIDIIERTSVDSRQMKILIGLDYFSDFGESEFLLNIWNTILGDGLPQIVDIKYADKRKHPLKYTKTLVEKSKLARIENLKEYIQKLEEKPPAKRSIYEKIQFEIEYMGYAVTRFDNIPNSYALVMDINMKATPVIDLYQLKSGKMIKVKIKKNRFYDINENPIITIGNLIKVSKTHTEHGWKLIDGKWEVNESVTWRFIDKLAIVNMN